MKTYKFIKIFVVKGNSKEEAVAQLKSEDLEQVIVKEVSEQSNWGSTLKKQVLGE